MAQIPFVGPSYNLDSRPASVQRTINLVPYPQEPGNERTKWVFKDVPGLVDSGVTLESPTLAISGETKEAADDEPFTATVTRFGATSGTSTATWTATGDTYDGVSGFQGPGDVFTGTVTFSPGETTQTIVFNLKLGIGTSFDLTVTLTDPTNATISIDSADLTATAAAPPETDPYFAGVILLLHPDDPLVDKSSYAQTLNNSNITLVTETYLGNTILMHNATNSGSNSLEVAATTSFNRSAGEPFTIEFTMRVNSIAYPTGTYLMSWADGGHYMSVTPAVGSATYALNLTDPAATTWGTGYTPGTWYQFAFTYDGSVPRTFANGTLVNTGTPRTSDAITGAQKYDVFRLVSSSGTPSTIADITEVRITRGVARYTASYTPRTTQFPNS